MFSIRRHILDRFCLPLVVGALLGLGGNQNLTAYSIPTNHVVAFTIESATSVALRSTWSDTSDPEYGFELGYQVNNAIAGSPNIIGTIAGSNITQVSYTLPASIAAAGAPIYFFVRGVATGGVNPLKTSWSSTNGYGYGFYWPNAASPIFNAPTNLVLTSVGEYTIGISFTDNANNEAGYEVHVRNSGAPTFDNLGDLGFDQTALTLNLFNSPQDIKIRCFRIVSSARVYTADLQQLNFNFQGLIAPTNLTQSATVPEQVVLNWTDNSAFEGNYEVQFRFGSTGTFQNLAYVNGNITTYTVPNVPPELIQFRVRATRGAGPDQFSDFSSNVSSTTSLKAPTGLTATIQGERSVKFDWTDNSGVEQGYIVQARLLPSGSFFDIGSTAANAQTLTVIAPNIPFPGTAYEFQVLTGYDPDGTGSAPVVLSNPSNVVSSTLPLNAPTGLQLQGGSLTDTQAVLTWTDASSAEGGFEILSRPGGSSSAPTTFAFVAANVTTATVPLSPGTSREFFVRSFFVRTTTVGDVALSSNSNGVTVNAKDAMNSAIYVEIVKDVLMTPYTLTNTSQSALVSRNITGLPAGLSFNSTSGEVTGTPTGSGVVQSTVALTFADGWAPTRTLVFRVLLAPAVATFPNQSATLGSPSTVSLTGKFTDPDASSAARVNTNLTVNGGNMDFILFNADTPLHVANFMGYATRGDYVNTVFHRSIAGFISQGGAFRAGTGATDFTAVSTVASPTNEPGVSNVRGTVALAKLGGQPSSGTNQFFVNLAHNGPNLDFQNGGFTAFGRVTAPGMAVADALAALPTSDYNVTVGSTASTFEDFPINSATAPATMNNALAVKINSVTALPVLSYTLVSNSVPTIATASITGTDLSLTPVGLGSTVLVVRATDLDGLTIDHSVTISVGGIFAVTVTPDANGLNLSWPVVQNTNQYEIFRRTNGGMLIPVGQSLGGSFSDTSSIPGSSISYVVRAHIGNTFQDSVESSVVVWVGTPEIAIYEGAGTSGPERQDNAGLFSFPNTTVGVTSAARTLTIKNTGPGTLTGLSLNHDGDQSADYTLGSLGATTLASNESTSFTVTFTPSGEGTRRAYVHIGSSDGDENPFDVSLSGAGVAARVPTLAEQYATQANDVYTYFSSRGDQRSALAYWFYFRAFSDQARHTSEGNAALAAKEYYQGLAYFYYTLLEGEAGRLYFYYLYLGYAELTYRTAQGDTAGANAYFTYYYTLALSFAGV